MGGKGVTTRDNAACIWIIVIKEFSDYKKSWKSLETKIHVENIASEF